MSHEHTVTVGSGTVPHIATFPGLNFTDSTYPVPNKAESLRTRRGTGSIIINPEDFSVFIDLRTQAISVSTTATALPVNPLEFRRAIAIHNDGPGILYIGGAGVTALNGLPIAVNEKIAFDAQGPIKFFGISASSSNVRIMEVS